jgi:RHS repeat-associated protein
MLQNGLLERVLEGRKAFGMGIKNREYVAFKNFRYGFNGKEKDGEVSGDGNQYDYGFRIYNPRLGKFLSVDPLSDKYAMLTPYQFASNTPIRAIDLDGLEAAEVGKNNPYLVIVVLGRAGGAYGDKTEANKTQYKNLPAPYNSNDDGLALIQDFDYSDFKPAVVTFSGSDDNMTSKDVAQTIKNYRVNNPEGKIILIGHSIGGKDVINAAIQVENDETIKNKTIDVLITIEPVKVEGTVQGEPYTGIVGENVKSIINYNADKSNFKGGGAKSSDTNVPQTDITTGKGTNHTNIDNTILPALKTIINLFRKGLNAVKVANHIKDIPLPIKNNGDTIPGAEGGTSE